MEKQGYPIGTREEMEERNYLDILKSYMGSELRERFPNVKGSIDQKIIWLEEQLPDRLPLDKALCLEYVSFSDK